VVMAAVRRWEGRVRFAVRAGVAGGWGVAGG
jgi:hypothetical protein